MLQCYPPKDPTRECLLWNSVVVVHLIAVLDCFVRLMYETLSVRLQSPGMLLRDVRISESMVIS